jgi:hypothetical protein
MNIGLTETISFVELLWTVMAAFGFTLHMALVVDAIKDKAALKALRPNGPRNLIANINLWDDASRAVLQIAFLTIGVYAMITPPNPYSAQSALPGVVIILMEIMLIVVSISDLRAKAALLGMMARYTLTEVDVAPRSSSLLQEPASDQMPPGSVAVSRADHAYTVTVTDKETCHDDTQP